MFSVTNGFVGSMLICGILECRALAWHFAEGLPRFCFGGSYGLPIVTRRDSWTVAEAVVCDVMELESPCTGPRDFYCCNIHYIYI